MMEIESCEQVDMAGNVQIACNVSKNKLRNIRSKCFEIEIGNRHKNLKHIKPWIIVGLVISIRHRYYIEGRTRK